MPPFKIIERMPANDDAERLRAMRTKGEDWHKCSE
jgi:hypothetical protein